MKKKGSPKAGGHASSNARKRFKERGTSPQSSSRNPSQGPSIFSYGLKRLKEYLSTPVSGESLAVFRICVGLVMLLEAFALMRPNPAAISTGLTPLETYYTGSEINFHFPYQIFQWLPLLPAGWIYVLVGLMALAGLTVALGLWYRLSAAVLFLTWGYLFAVESTRTYWQSHYYLETLVLFLLMWMPAARRFSLDARIGRGRLPEPRHVPFWTLAALRGQLVIAYFYAGVAKINADWLLDAVPVRWFLSDPAVTAPYQPLLSDGLFDLFKGLITSTGFAYFISYTGLVFDLGVGFLLLIRRTRIFGLLLMILFHAINHFIIFDDISWFPLLGITTALILLEPNWPSRTWQWLRRPRICRPDWAWLTGGTVLVPPVGAALGWKLKPDAPVRLGGGGSLMSSRAAVLLLVWLVWQSVMPLRHYFIAGDARFTYEGLSFSWRLKTDTRRATSAQIHIRDPQIVSRGATVENPIRWDQWHGDRVLYRVVDPAELDWRELPEIVVILERTLGERILYNPYAAQAQPESESAMRERVKQLWERAYGRTPARIEFTLAFPGALEAYASELNSTGLDRQGATFSDLASRVKLLAQNRLNASESSKTIREVRALLEDPGAHERLVPFLRRVHPYSLEGGAQTRRPFLVIEDRPLLSQTGRDWFRVRRDMWRDANLSLKNGAGRKDIQDTEPLIIHMGKLGDDAAEMLPQMCIIDSQRYPERPPYIWWNSLKELNPSKIIHISNQAFYLRRYARRVAGIWEKEYGRRPAVHTLTSVSLNGRPYQPLVNPEADLASVEVRWFTHNPWIMHLQTPRIPREVLDRGMHSAGP